MTMRRFVHVGILERRREAYSRARVGEWMEQGPTMTRTRSSWPERIRAAPYLAEAIVCWELIETGSSERRRAGWIRGSY